MRKIFGIKSGFKTNMIVATLVCLFFHFAKNMQISKLWNKNTIVYIQNGHRKAPVTNPITGADAVHSNPCTYISMPKIEQQTDYWQPVHEDSTAFVFSAYFIREPMKIIVIAIRKLEITKLYFCQLWHKERGTNYVLLYQIDVKILSLPKHHDRPYAAELFECRFNPRTAFLPSLVSIVDINCTVQRNILFVQHMKKPETVSRNFTLCLPPLYGNISIYRFVEWIELNRILGADKLFVYNYTSNKEVQTVLNFYVNKGFINIFHWNLPVIQNASKLTNPISVHYHGQIAALNDCLYRNKYESEFIVNVDIDEFIIPHVENETTWHQMLTHVDENKTVYIVRNTFFRTYFDIENIEISNKSLVEKYKLISLQNLYHEEKIFYPGARSKYIARTLNVSSLAIHTAWNESRFSLPVNAAIMHHYRDKSSKKELEGRKVLDRTVSNLFGEVLIKKVATVWSELDKTTSDNAPNN